jgi:hypothetical protein
MPSLRSRATICESSCKLSQSAKTFLLICLNYKKPEQPTFYPAMRFRRSKAEHRFGFLGLRRFFTHVLPPLKIKAKTPLHPPLQSAPFATTPPPTSDWLHMLHPWKAFCGKETLRQDGAIWLALVAFPFRQTSHLTICSRGACRTLHL